MFGGCVATDTSFMVAAIVAVVNISCTRIDKDGYVLYCTNLPKLVHSYTSLYLLLYGLKIGILVFTIFKVSMCFCSV